jgi:Tat protein secretion system quality control protein TatD with DNase activity
LEEVIKYVPIDRMMIETDALSYASEEYAENAEQKK